MNPCLSKKSLFKQTYKNIMCTYMMDPEAGTRGLSPTPHPLINYKNIGLLRKTGPDPLKNHKAAELVFNVWPMKHKTPFK